MYRNNQFNNQLMDKKCYRNYMNQNYYYQLIANNQNQINLNFIPFQYFQNNNNNFNIYKNTPINIKNNIFIDNINKFDYFYPKNYRKNSQFVKNNFINQNNANYANNADNAYNDEYNNLKNEETSFKEKEIKNNKKYSMDSTDSNKSSNPSSDEEKDEIEEKEMESLKLNDIENEKCFRFDENDNISKNKKGERRLSNTSKISDCSKYSKSTLNTSISSIKEKDVSDEKNNNLKKTDFENKKVENKTIVKYQGNPALENTEILNVKVKISKDRTAIFKLKRYDDLFLTIKLFCEINSIDEKLIKPLIIKSLSTLNTIYQVMNSNLDNQQINILKKIKNKE